MITADKITDKQIRELRISFVRAADHYHAALCAVAQDDEFSEPTLSHLTDAQRRAVCDMPVAVARARCADILNARASGKES